MSPLQVRFPVVPSNVQPVSAEPPEKAIVPLAPVGPTLIVVVAPPPKLMVVAVVLIRSKDVLPVVMEEATLGEVILGVLLNTATPVPVSSERELERSALAPVVEILLEELMNKALLAVRDGRLIVASARVVVPVPAPRVVVPVPLALSVSPVSEVDGDIVGFAPANVSAVPVNVSELIVPVTSRLLSASTSPPENSN